MASFLRRLSRHCYPQIFDDATVGAEAKKIFAEANAMLKDLISSRKLTASAIVTIWPANSVGDDIEVYADESRSQVLGVFHGLREQSQKETLDPYHCISDFVAPKGTVPDYVGAFACSAGRERVRVAFFVALLTICAGFGVDEVCAAHQKDSDDFKSIMTKALADRCAEALAELLHQRVRTTIWGYAAEEKLGVEDCIGVKYQGARGVKRSV